jgi:predicted RNase H-like HicB family nuclease
VTGQVTWYVVSTDRGDWIVEVLATDEGLSVGCPALPGCFSEGDTLVEALANIRDAIQEYLAAQ